LRWSSDQSTRRLKSIAAVRAKTMQASTRSSVRTDGRPFAATTNAPRANGRAKTVWEKRISRRNLVTGPPSPLASPCRSSASTAI